MDTRKYIFKVALVDHRNGRIIYVVTIELHFKE